MNYKEIQDNAQLLFVVLRLSQTFDSYIVLENEILQSLGFLIEVNFLHFESLKGSSLECRSQKNLKSNF